MEMIDFLPEHYRLMQQRRRAGVWRVLTVGAVLILMAASSTMVVWQRQGLARQIKTLERREGEVTAALQEVASLKQERTKLARLATLLCLVRCQTPMSRILSAIASAVPDSVTVTSISIGKQGDGHAPTETDGRQRGRRRRRTRRSVGTSKTKHFGDKEADIERVRNDVQSSRFSVVIQGLADSDTQIALMLGSLSGSGILEKANMSYSEPDETGGIKRRKFQVVCQSAPVTRGPKP